ncbi:MAG: PhzF family phenazine biosynthesis protein [bacterium]|nr:PhzF family phenazine biosynthesis protein [bacterium]
MRELSYELVDVFTDVAFGGNQLAVFTEPGDLPAETMQKIARELNLSETVFVLPPQDAANHFHLRIFTPGMELPFAGHPTVGTGFVLHRLGKTADTQLRLEEGVGVIEVGIQPQPGGKVLVTMQQPVPQFGTIYEDRATLAAVLSLSPDDLIDSLPAQVVSSGVPFLFIPVKGLREIGRSRVRLDLWEQHVRDFAAPHLFVFTPEVERSGSTVHSRMFAPAMGIAEDPATGGASGPLGAYLVRYGLARAASEGVYTIVSEQGLEMGRPSFIQITIQGTPDQITGASIGGYSQPIGRGFLYLPG